MPTYRKLHTKIIDSYDFAEMPDDFTRVMWMLLIVVADSEGRAIDNPAWIRSRMFPLRNDIDNKQIEKSLSWLNERKMIVRYSINGRNYFYVPKFKTYQTGTEKEAKSVLPAPQELLQSKSRVTPDEVGAAASASVNESASDNVSVNEPEPFFEKSELSAAFEKASNILAPGTDAKRWIASIEHMEKLNITPLEVEKAVFELNRKNYVITGPWSIVNAAVNVHGKSGNGHKPAERVYNEEYQ